LTQVIYLPGRNTNIQIVDLYNPGRDGGYLESFQYLLLIWTSLLSFLIFKKKQVGNTFFLPLTYFFLFADDYLRIHDKIVSLSLRQFDYLGLIQDAKIRIGPLQIIRYKDIGEILYWLIVLVFFILALSLSFNSVSNLGKRYLISNILFFVCLAFFAVFIDLINANVPTWFVGQNYQKPIKEILIFIEEFGEISSISYAFIWNFNFLVSKKN